MPDDTPLNPRHFDQPRADFPATERGLEFIMEQISRLPTRRELTKYAFVILAVGALLGIVGIEAMAIRSDMQPLRLIVAGIVVGTFALAPCLASASEHRSLEVNHEFQRQHPCPSTGQTTGRCPGYIKDRVLPLACGGPDSAANLQWQTVSAAKAKDR